MHIEPGVVVNAKMILSYGTAAFACGFLIKEAIDSIIEESAMALLIRGALATLLVLCFFEVLPHYAVGVSEVHLILGSTLFLFFGAPAAAIGLAGGLLLQGLFFAPFDLPQYAVNITTLLAPLFAMRFLAGKIIGDDRPYVSIKYSQALQLSVVYQGGIVSWVAFWALYGQGFSAANLAQIASFGLAYSSIILIEPLIDLGALAGAKALNRHKTPALFEKRLYSAA
jgi:hypothetical protein